MPDETAVRGIVYATGVSAGHRYWCVAHPTSTSERTHMVSERIERADGGRAIETWEHLGPCDGSCHQSIPAVVAIFLKGGPIEHMQIGVTNDT